MKKPDYEEFMFGSLGGSIVSESEIRKTLCYLNLRDGAVLDIGTGSGRVAREIHLLGVEVIGVDKDRNMIETGLERNQFFGNASEYKMLVADGQFLPFRESSFDAVVCIRVLKYFSDHALGIKEFSRVLKADGKLVLEISNVFSWAALARIHTLIMKHNMGYPTLFIFQKIKKILAENGLVVTKYTGLHKIEPWVLRQGRNPYMVKLLRWIEAVLQRLTPKQLLSRGLLLQCTKR